MGKGVSWCNFVLDYLWRGYSTYSPAIPTSGATASQVALLLQMPPANAQLNSSGCFGAGIEVGSLTSSTGTYQGYARQNYLAGASQWTATNGGTGANSSGTSYPASIQNTTAISFPAATLTWGPSTGNVAPVVGWALIITIATQTYGGGAGYPLIAATGLLPAPQMVFGPGTSPFFIPAYGITINES